MRLPLILTIAMLLLGIGLDAAIYFSLPVKSRKGITCRLIYFITALLTNLLAVIIMVWPKRDADSGIIPVMWLLYAWMSIYIPKLIYCIFLLISLIPRMFGKRRYKIERYLGLPLALLLFCAMWYGAIWGRRQIDVQQITISSERIPKAFNDYRIVQFSDAHVGTWGSDTTYISTLVDSINALNPDLIVFTGDIVNRKTSEIRPFIPVLSRLKAPDGVYSIMGNHDYGDYTNWPSEQAHAENTLQLREIQKQIGWKLLEDEHVWLHAGNDSIALIGVENWGEPPFPSYGDFEKASAGLTGEDFSILLSHNPMHWHNIVRYSHKADLTLSGHTHAMQSRLRTPWGDYSLSSIKYPEWEGLTEFKREDGSKSRVYVNIGCGEVGFPARIGAAPELTVITLSKE